MGSVLDCLIFIFSIEGLEGSSTVISPILRWTAESYALSLGTDISPALKNAEKHKQQAAQSIFMSRESPFLSHTPLICLRMRGVIGSRSLWPPPHCLGLMFLHPSEYILQLRHTYPMKRTPQPLCNLEMVDRYDLINLCFNPSFARKDTYEHTCDSLIGRGAVADSVQNFRYQSWALL